MSNGSIDGYDEPSRSRGIFTQSDREYILSRGEGYSRQAGHARQQAISERFSQAVLDLALLADLPDEERRKLLLSDGGDKDTLQRSRATTRAALAFFYQLAGDLGGADFEHLLEEAIVQAEQKNTDRGEVVFRTADVTISPPEIFDPDRLTAMGESVGEELTRQELMILLVLNYEVSDRELDSSLEDVAENIMQYWARNQMMNPFPEREIDRGDE